MWGLALADFGRDPSIGGEFERDGFSKKNPQKLLTKFPGLATSGSHNS